jgi:hypothetical protein
LPFVLRSFDPRQESMGMGMDAMDEESLYGMLGWGRIAAF